MRNIILAAAAALLMSAIAPQAATVGNDVIDRQYGDGYSDFGFAFSSDVFPDGVIHSWSTWIENIDLDAASGVMGLMVLSSEDGNNFTVKYIDIQTVFVGLNTFASAIAVSAGDILGLYIGDAKVSFDYASDGSTDNYAVNGLFGSAPTVGDTYLFGGTLDRTYSVVTTMPLPASLPLVLVGLAAFCLIGRKRRKAA